MLQLMPGGVRRWWLVDVDRNRIARVDPPTKPLTKAQEATIMSRQSHLTTLSDPETITLEGVVVTPRIPLRC